MLPRGHLTSSICSPEARGTGAPCPPHNPAREATPRDRGLRLPWEPVHSYIPVPHPKACSPLSTRLESRAPQHVLHTWQFSQDRFPQPYPDPKEHTPTNETSASRRLGDSNRRQYVHDTFAIAVKEHGSERAAARARSSGW